MIGFFVGGFLFRAPDVPQQVARQLPERVFAHRLHVNIHARLAQHIFRQAGECDLIHVPPREKRQRQPPARVNLDVFAIHLPRDLQHCRQLVYQRIHAVDRTAPSAGTPQFFEVNGDAVARTIVGHAAARAIVDAAAHAGQADAPHALAHEVGLIRLAVRHLHAPQGGQQDAEHREHRAVEQPQSPVLFAE
ncbi:MAG: hypothetical protein BWY59_00858 [Verrucomicrobia bacterium ADurb.Bin345]|nr:MAG: hypothetical protein BWY59_00858 [Verrucomicrobia bacterium ADurb.Bin345]